MNEITTDTLRRPVVAALVERLYAEAHTSDTALRARFEAIPAAERARRIAEATTDYRAFYGSAKDMYLAVGRETATLLYMLARSIRARHVVEFGTSFGISTIHLAAALRDNGGGRIVGSELLPAKIARARENLAVAGLADLVDIREGDALVTLASNLPSPIDLVLLDGHKPLYAPVLDLLAPHLRPGAVLVADNADACPEYVARVRAPGGGFLSVPFADDVEMSIKL